MSDDNSTDKTAVDRTGDDHPGNAEGNGPSEIPDETVASESELSLDKVAAKREAEGK